MSRRTALRSPSERWREKQSSRLPQFALRRGTPTCLRWVQRRQCTPHSVPGMSSTLWRKDIPEDKAGGRTCLPCDKEALEKKMQHQPESESVKMDPQEISSCRTNFIKGLRGALLLGAAFKENCSV